MLPQPLYDRHDLFDSLALAKDDLWYPLPYLPLNIQSGVPQVVVGKSPQAIQSLVHIALSGLQIK
jgi:hypothetical protein